MKKDNKTAVESFMLATKALLQTSQTMEDIYRATMDRNPLNAAYIYFDDSGRAKTKTYQDFADQTFKTASKLSTLLSGTPAGSVVGLKIKNSPRWGILFWALLMTGHTPLLIDAKLAKENTDNLLRQAEASALLANDEEEFIVPKYRVNEILNEEPDYNFNPKWADNVIFCSSGTTGDAKLMVYNGKNLVAQIVESISMPEVTTDIMYPSKDLRILAMLPFHHIFGFVAVFLWYTYYGKTIVYPSSMSTSDLLYAARKSKITHVYSVPLFWDSVAQALVRQTAMLSPSKSDIFAKMVAFNNHKISKKEAGLASKKFVIRKFQKNLFGPYVRYCISGGGFLSPKTSSLINGVGYPLYNGFGMTEVGVTSVELSPRVEQRLKGSIGKPLYGVEYRIQHREGANPEDNSGELYVKSPVIHVEEIVGGVRKPTELVDGFYPTGDIATIDNQGNYFLKGRIKDTIILANGENVFPDEIEYYFKGVKNIRNMVCLGAKHPGDSEEKITLVCEVENTVGDEDIKKINEDIKSINNTLPSEKKVQVILIDKSPLPMSGSMKVKRFVLKEAIEKGNGDFLDLNGNKKDHQVSFEGFAKEDVAKVVKKVTKLFAKTLTLPEFKIGPDDVWNTDLGGDSMSYIEMVQNLDKEFKLTIPEDLYGILLSVHDFAKQILVMEKESGAISSEKKKSKAKGNPSSSEKKEKK